MHDLLIQFALAIVVAINPNLLNYEGQKEITRAAVAAVLDDADNAPVFSSHNEDLAVIIYWAYKESSFRRYMHGDAHRSFGPWQLRADWAAGRSVGAQAREWLRLLHLGKRICPDSPGGIMWGVRIVKPGTFACDVPVPGWPGWTTGDAANERVSRARRLMISAIAEDETRE
jgi:hypothetical protein